MSRNKVIIVIIIVAILVFSSSILAISVTSGNKLPKQLQLGEKYLLDGKYEKAILAFEKAIKTDSRNVEAKIGLGKAYVAVGREVEEE